MEIERILCAAIYVDTGLAEPVRLSHSYPKTGLVFAAWRHSDCFTTMLAWSERLNEFERLTYNLADFARVHPNGAPELTQEQLNVMRQGLRGYDQGFLTSKGRYVTREEAAQIAFDAGQMLGRADSLMSEDLY